MTVLYLGLVTGTVLCAVMAIRAVRLMGSALWLAGASAVLALILYLLGAHEIAVMELSIGAGLVSVLFVFAINIAGEDTIDLRMMLPRPLALGLVVLALLLLGWLVMPPVNIDLLPSSTSTSFGQVLWEDRSLDGLAQLVMIFAGVLGVLGLLAEARSPVRAQGIRLARTPRDRAPAEHKEIHA